MLLNLGFRGVDADNPGVDITYRDKYKSLASQQRHWLKRRQAIEPAIGHTKSDNRMDRCWLQGALGDALHALSCAAGYNIRWLLRAIVRLAAKRLCLALPDLAPYARISVLCSGNAVRRSLDIVAAAFGHPAAFAPRSLWASVRVKWAAG